MFFRLHWYHKALLARYIDALPFDENILAYVTEILSNMDELGLIEPSNL